MNHDTIEALRALGDEQGRVSPTRVVEAARDPKSPLHRYFEWDDAAAAHQHRLGRARVLLRSVRVEITRHERVITSIAYVRDPQCSGHEQGYVAVERLGQVTPRATEVLLTELERVAGLLNRSMSLAETLGFGTRVEGLMNEVENLLADIRQAVREDKAA